MWCQLIMEGLGYFNKSLWLKINGEVSEMTEEQYRFDFQLWMGCYVSGEITNRAGEVTERAYLWTTWLLSEKWSRDNTVVTILYIYMHNLIPTTLALANCMLGFFINLANLQCLYFQAVKSEISSLLKIIYLAIQYQLMILHS